MVVQHPRLVGCLEPRKRSHQTAVACFQQKGMSENFQGGVLVL